MIHRAIPTDDIKLQDATPDDLRQAAAYLSGNGEQACNIGSGFLLRMANLLDNNNCKSAAQFEGGITAVYNILIRKTGL